MPIPDTPYTRKEAYLNAAATGDSSGIPETPYTREEMYLDAIAKGGGGGGGASALSGLTDVDISNPTDGQVLVYNAESGKWENGSSGGGALIVHWSHDEVHGIYTLDKTWKEIADAILVGPVLLLLDDIGAGEYNVSSILIDYVEINNGNYNVSCSQGNFDTDSENGYPSYQAD